MSDKVVIQGYKLPKKFKDFYYNDPYVRAAINTGVNNRLPLEDVLLMLCEALIESKDSLMDQCINLQERSPIAGNLIIKG